MKKRLFFGALLTLAICGCFFGGEEDSPTSPPKEVPNPTGSRIGFISPGIYHGDFTSIDSGLTDDDFETEFILYADGSYELYWIANTMASAIFKGNWAQHDSSVFLLNTKQARIQNGFIDDFTSIEDDTNSIRNVLDNSFIKKEYTPFRSKPYWITYTKKKFPALAGSYQYTERIPYLLPPKDSLDTVMNIDTLEAKYTITFNGIEMTYRENDTLEYYQLKANWVQMSSLVRMQNNQERVWLDSTQSFSAWSTVPGSILWRILETKDSALNIWNPIYGDWQIFHRLPQAK